MTPTEVAIRAEMERATVDGVVRVSVALMNDLLAQRDRYEKALREYADPMNWFDHEDDGGGYLCWYCKHGKEDKNGPEIAQEALRCE